MEFLKTFAKATFAAIYGSFFELVDRAWAGIGYGFGISIGIGLALKVF